MVLRPSSPQTAPTRLWRVLLVLLVGLAVAVPASADDAAHAAAKKKAIKGLGKKLGKLVGDPRLDQKEEELTALLNSLETYEGPSVAHAAIKGAAIPNEAARERIFVLIETHHDAKLLKPLVAMLQAKPYRHDHDLRKRLIRALAVLADAKALEPLSEVIRYSEDPEVVLAACDAMNSFVGAPIASKREPVKRMVDLYETTWNLAKSIRPQDRLQVKVAADKLRVYGRALRAALQAMTHQQLTQAREWRRWWNDCKKARDWKTCRMRR